MPPEPPEQGGNTGGRYVAISFFLSSVQQITFDTDVFDMCCLRSVTLGKAREFFLALPSVFAVNSRNPVV